MVSRLGVRKKRTGRKGTLAMSTCFTEALKLKVELVLTTDEYEAFMLWPDEAFGAASMERSELSKVTEAELSEGATVDKCSMPAFLKLQRSAEESALVNYRKFKRTDAETRSKAEVLSKALVIADRLILVGGPRLSS